MSRHGMALPLALFTLVIAAVMITAVFYVARLEKRMGDNSVASVQAFEAAETGVAGVISAWSATRYDTLTVGGTMTLPTAAVGNDAISSISIRRLNAVTFVVQAEGQYLVGGQVITRRQVARLLRLDPPGIQPNAAITSRLGLEVAGAADVNGRDSVPTAWGGVCPGPGPAAPGIRDSSGAVVITPPCTLATCVSGTPQVQTDPAVTSSDFTQFGSVTFAELAAIADKTISGTVGGLAPTTDPGPVCRTSDPGNWGEPLDPSSVCGNYFPVIYAPGDVTLTGGRGQGVLLVEGDLTVSGPVEFYGPVVVQGAVHASAGDIIGALMVANNGASSTQIDGTATVTFSRCVLNRSVTATSQPTALRERSWVQLY
jgi:hypothetical protein